MKKEARQVDKTALVSLAYKSAVDLVQQLGPGDGIPVTDLGLTQLQVLSLRNLVEATMGIVLKTRAGVLYRKNNQELANEPAVGFRRAKKALTNGVRRSGLVDHSKISSEESQRCDAQTRKAEFALKRIQTIEKTPDPMIVEVQAITDYSSSVKDRQKKSGEGED